MAEWRAAGDSLGDDTDSGEPVIVGRERLWRIACERGECDATSKEREGRGVCRGGGDSLGRRRQDREREDEDEDEDEEQGSFFERERDDRDRGEGEVRQFSCVFVFFCFWVARRLPGETAKRSGSGYFQYSCQEKV